MQKSYFLLITGIAIAVLLILAASVIVLSHGGAVIPAPAQYAPVSATTPAPAAKILYFYRTSCPACALVNENGVIDRVSGIVPVERYNMDTGEGIDLYSEVVNRFGANPSVPMAVVIGKTGTVTILTGYPRIPDQLEDAARGIVHS